MGFRLFVGSLLVSVAVGLILYIYQKSSSTHNPPVQSSAVQQPPQAAPAIPNIASQPSPPSVVQNPDTISEEPNPSTPSTDPAGDHDPALPSPKLVTGRFTYTLHRSANPSREEQKAYANITTFMNRAIGYYNKYTTLNKHLNVYYSPGTPTADGSSNGSIRIGKHAFHTYTMMHEISHTLGIGTHPRWKSLVVKGIFTGRHATETLREITGNPNAQLHADRMHFWPYGLNNPGEAKTDQDLIRHCKMVQAICEDLSRRHK